MWSSILNGFGVGIGLIVAIGAQNLLVLQHGISKNFPVVTALICIVCDAALILLGVLGLGALLLSWPQMINWFRYLGALWLVYLAIQNLRAAFTSTKLEADAVVQVKTLTVTVASTLAVTLLNPHVYLDTVILLGGLSTQYAYPLYFALGAMLASTVWFSALAFAGVQLAPILSKPKAWRILNGVIGLILCLIALQLAFGFNAVIAV